MTAQHAILGFLLPKYAQWKPGVSWLLATFSWISETTSAWQRCICTSSWSPQPAWQSTTATSPRSMCNPRAESSSLQHAHTLAQQIVGGTSYPYSRHTTQQQLYPSKHASVYLVQQGLQKQPPVEVDYLHPHPEPLPSTFEQLVGTCKQDVQSQQALAHQLPPHPLLVAAHQDLLTQLSALLLPPAAQSSGRTLAHCTLNARHHHSLVSNSTTALASPHHHLATGCYTWHSPYRSFMAAPRFAEAAEQEKAGSSTTFEGSPSNSPFAALGIDTKLCAALQAMQIMQPSPIQAAAIPPILAGKNCALQSFTGSGKTLAYLLPALTLAAARDKVQRQEKATTWKDAVQVLVLAPSHELAQQVMQAAQQVLGEERRHLVQLLLGGANPKRQHEALRHRKPLVVVGTPGRVLDFVLDGTLRVHGCPMLVLDEADQLLHYHHEQVGQLCELVGKNLEGGRQTVIVSASMSRLQLPEYQPWCPHPIFLGLSTMPPSVLNAAGPMVRDGSSSGSTATLQRLAAASLVMPPHLHHYYIIAEPHMKVDKMRRVMHAVGAAHALVFHNSRGPLLPTKLKLEAKSMDVTFLHGNLSKLERTNVTSAFRRGLFRALVTTDVMARGVDFAECDAVFHLDFPDDCMAYAHRAGRTGRMGAPGVVFSVVTKHEVKYVHLVSKQLGVDILPTSISHGKLMLTTDMMHPNLKPRIIAQAEASITKESVIWGDQEDEVDEGEAARPVEPSYEYVRQLESPGEQSTSAPTHSSSSSSIHTSRQPTVSSTSDAGSSSGMHADSMGSLDTAGQTSAAEQAATVSESGRRGRLRRAPSPLQAAQQHVVAAADLELPSATVHSEPNLEASDMPVDTSAQDAAYALEWQQRLKQATLTPKEQALQDLELLLNPVLPSIPTAATSISGLGRTASSEQVPGSAGASSTMSYKERMLLAAARASADKFPGQDVTQTRSGKTNTAIFEDKIHDGTQRGGRARKPPTEQQRGNRKDAKGSVQAAAADGSGPSAGVAWLAQEQHRNFDLREFKEDGMPFLEIFDQDEMQEQERLTYPPRKPVTSKQQQMSGNGRPPSPRADTTSGTRSAPGHKESASHQHAGQQQPSASSGSAGHTQGHKGSQGQHAEPGSKQGPGRFSQQANKGEGAAANAEEQSHHQSSTDNNDTDAQTGGDDRQFIPKWQLRYLRRIVR